MAPFSIILVGEFCVTIYMPYSSAHLRILAEPCFAAVSTRDFSALRNSPIGTRKDRLP